MRIAVNGLAIRVGQPGVGRTTRNLVGALLRACPDDEFFLYVAADAPRDLGLEGPNLVRVDTRFTLKTPLDLLCLASFELPGPVPEVEADVVYSPSFLLPRLPARAGRRVETLHDLTWDRLPKARTLLFRSYMHRRLDEVVRHARRLVCVSQSTAEDLQALRSKVPDGLPCVVHHGVDLEVFGPQPAEDAGAPFLVVVGSQDSRAQIRTLADAFPRVRARMRPCRRASAGSAGPRPPTPPTIDFIGQLEETEIAALYRRALMLVQPSAYEGFGLPVLEAMACGTAVACADTPLLREITAGCARYFDPQSASSIAAAMEDLVRADGPRDRLVGDGLRRAAGFAWSRTAARLRSVFREVAS